MNSHKISDNLERVNDNVVKKVSTIKLQTEAGVNSHESSSEPERVNDTTVSKVELQMKVSVNS